MPAAMFEAGTGPRRISSMAEIEHLGWPSTTHEVLAVPLQRVDQPERLLLVAGDLDTGYEQVLAVVGHLLSIRLEALVRLRQAHVRHTLKARFEQRDLRFNARLAAVLRDASGLVRATEARVLLPEGEGQGLRVLASVGAASATPPPGPVDVTSRSVTPTRIVLPVARTAFGTALLDIGAPAGRTFDHDDVALATAAADVIRPWLTGALDALAETGRGHLLVGPDSGFEARIHDEIERAKRLQWPTGLIVVDTQEVAGDLHALALAPVVDALRSHLRSSDLVGRLSDGHLAALLVHTSLRAVESVAGRVEGELARLAHEVAVPRAAVGRATYPIAGETAAALLAAARADIRHAAVAPLPSM
jgi:GGDEF domain-containing protein